MLLLRFKRGREPGAGKGSTRHGKDDEMKGKRRQEKAFHFKGLSLDPLSLHSDPDMKKQENSPGSYELGSLDKRSWRRKSQGTLCERLRLERQGREIKICSHKSTLINFPPYTDY